MILIGELINASRKPIHAAVENGDAAAIRQVAADQTAAGAHYIDVNAGMFAAREPEYIQWLVTEIQDETGMPCSLDSPDPRAIEAGLAVHKGAAFINSISLEKKRYDDLLPLVAGTDLKVVALCMSDAGMPETVDDRLAIADKLVNGLLQHNVRAENIFVDPLVQPVATNDLYGRSFLDSISRLMTRFQGVHTMCGLSNISYGLPERRFLNQTFMVMAIAMGLDGAIVNPLDRRMMANIVAAEALAGKDEFCGNFLAAYRANRFDL